MQHKILLVDNDAAVTDLLTTHLLESGCEVITAKNGPTGLGEARAKMPSLIVLDMDLPKISGFNICRQLRSDLSTRHIPIIVLSSLDSEENRILAFELGADDYVPKPFSVREVILRIKKSLDRALQRPEPLREKVTLRELTLDPGRHEVIFRDQPVNLTRIEFRLLALLMEHNGRTFSRGSLMEVVWGQRSDTNTRTIDSHVRRLRAKLGQAGDAIETVVGYGYRFNEKFILPLAQSANRELYGVEVDIPVPRLAHARVKFSGSEKRRTLVLAHK